MEENNCNMCSIKQSDIDEIKETQKDMQSSLTLINAALLGNDFQPDGIIHRVRKVEKEQFVMNAEKILPRIDELEKFKADTNKLIYKIVGAVIASGTIVGFIFKYLL